MKTKLKHMLVVFALSAVSANAALANEAEVDPWAGFNRGIHNFNDGLDSYVLKPAAKGYKAVMPDPAEKGVNNFFGNLADVRTMINNVLQGKFENAGRDFARVAFNSTFGLGGFIDVSTPMGIKKNDEDFGQTLGYWGVESGPYLVLPFLGSTTVRDGISLIPDSLVDPVTHIDDNGARNALYITRVVDQRANLLEAEKLISGDKYIFIRDAYLQKRKSLIADGEIEDYDDSNF